jgi:hypothetical protein
VSVWAKRSEERRKGGEKGGREKGGDGGGGVKREIVREQQFEADKAESLTAEGSA